MNSDLKKELDRILIEAKAKPLSVSDVFEILRGKGYSLFIILFSIPFAFPITIPGVSTPFGIAIAIIGLRIAFAKKMWWPKKILAYTIPYSFLQKIIVRLIWIEKKIHRIFHPRFSFLATNPTLHIIHGLFIALLGVFLALPLPIPFTNTIPAITLLCIGFGLLEEDGIMILIGYAFFTICIAAIFGIFWFAHNEFRK